MTRDRNTNYRLQYALFGVGFGLCFPLLATIVAMWTSGESLFEVHSSQPLLWIINSAPFVLGFVASIAGQRQDRVQEIMRNDEQTRMRAVLENVVDGIITITDQGIIESFNPAAESIFGYEQSEVIGKNVNLLMPTPYHEEHDQYLLNYLDTHVPKVIGIGREVVGLRKDGSTFPMDLAVSEMEFGDSRGFTGIVRDITERKKIDEMKNEFISTVSHELRTPLTSIRGSLGLVSGGMTGEISGETRSLIDIALNNTNRLVRLINDILDIEKIESGTMAFERKRFEMSSLLIETIEANQGFAEEFDVELIGQISTEAVVVGDRDRVVQVLTNLVSNAIKFSPTRGTVTVRMRNDPAAVGVYIDDEGPGIPEEFKGQIFGKFSQADSSDTRQKGGSGLGLSIAKSIVEGHGGTIGFTAREGGGTTFYFELPRVKQDQTQVPVDSDKPKILVLEDDADVARLLEIMLNSAGMATDVAPDAATAKELLKTQDYAAMTVDIMLPGQDGISLIRELRGDERTAQLPIVVVSAVAKNGQAQLGNSYAVVDWIEKPIDPDRLAASIQRATTPTSSNRSRILHVEDDEDVIKVVAAILGKNFDVIPARTLEEARQLIASQNFDVVILDRGMPDGSGLSLLPALKESAPNTAVIIFSSDEVDAVADVAKTLVKSTTSNEQLLNTIQLAIANRST